MTDASKYSALDRLLHRIAFGGSGWQRMLSDLEDRIYAKQIALTTLDRPVFITSLPRAGTTLLLEVIVSAPQFVTHTYREMPFLLCPLLWSAYSSRLRTAARPVERAHGDGMTVSFDSAEAFEEALWHMFWPEKYANRRIRMWDASERYEEFDDFLVRHIRKLLVLRAQGDGRRLRYASKNNANVARTAYLRRLFPDCVILVPFRDPVEHVASMFRQHQNFGTMHRSDRFALEYMEAIGHFEFGEAQRPIDFYEWSGPGGSRDANDVNYWLHYWTAAYRHVLESVSDQAVLIDYDQACLTPDALLAALVDLIEVDPADRGILLEQTRRFHAPRTHGRDASEFDPGLLRLAGDIHQQLRTRAVNRVG